MAGNTVPELATAEMQPSLPALHGTEGIEMIDRDHPLLQELPLTKAPVSPSPM